MAEGQRKKMSPLKRALIIIGAVVFALAAVFAFFMICDAVAHTKVRVVPDYEREDLSQVLEKPLDEWTDDDYSFIWKQTGLAKAYFDDVGRINKSFILSCQDDFFYDEPTEHDGVNFGSSHDYYPDKYFHMVPLQAGDVLISASVHTFGWQNGHAALCLNSHDTIQSLNWGSRSAILGTDWFCHAADFMVLRPKIPVEEREEIAEWARDNLQDIEYSLFTGIFNKKDQSDDVRTSHCSHLVWQAYMACGYDIDSTGGPVVSPRNIATCDLFEVVQANGFDLDKLWF